MGKLRALWCVAAGAALLGLRVWAGSGVEFQTEYRAAFEEARERNAPVFIFLGQHT